LSRLDGHPNSGFMLPEVAEMRGLAGGWLQFVASEKGR
jgi:hypothetical protein